MRKKMAIFVWTMVLCWGLPMSAWGLNPTLFFSIPASNPGATISYSGGANDLLVGNGIIVTEAHGWVQNPFDLRSPFQSIPITNGVLNFSLGPLFRFNSPQPNTWTFQGGESNRGNGGSITITGTTSAGTGTLLSGFFEGFDAAVVSQSSMKARFVASLGDGLAELLTDPPTTLTNGYSGVLNLSFIHDFDSSSPPGAFSSSMVTGGSIAYAPIPSSLLLLGSGLLGLAGFGRRILRNP